jgi:hypothetical protein
MIWKWKEAPNQESGPALPGSEISPVINVAEGEYTCKKLASGDFTSCICNDEHVLIVACICQSVAFQEFLPGSLVSEHVLLKYIQAMPLWRFS